MNNSILSKKSETFGLYEAALATLLFIVFNVVFMFLYNLLPMSMAASKPIYFLVSFMVEFLFALVSLSVAGLRNVKFFKACGINKKININIVFYGFLISVLSLVAFGDLTNIFLEFLGLCGYESVISGFSINNFGEYLIYVVITCLTPAVCEEILFRGTILSGLKDFGMKVSLVVSALIFMFMHGNPEQTIHQFIIGLIVGYLFLKSGNVWLGVIVHFFNNFIAVTQIYLLSMVTISTPTSVVVEQTMNPWVSLLVNLVVALIVAYFGYLLIKLLFKKMLHEDAKINGAQDVQETNATIMVDGKEIDAVITIDGDVIEPEKTEEEKQEQAVLDSEKAKKNEWTTPVIAMFSLSAAYLIFEWVISLCKGLGLF